MRAIVTLCTCAIAFTCATAHAQSAHTAITATTARGLVPSAAAGRSIGTSDGAGSITMIDRTAVQRLEIELDAIEELLPPRMP